MISFRVFQKQHLFQILLYKFASSSFIQLSNLNYAIYYVLQTKYPGSVLRKMRCLMTLKHRWQFAIYSRKMQEALWAHKFLQVIELAPLKMDQTKQLLNITPESIGITDSPEQKQVQQQMKGFFKAGPKGPILNRVVFNQKRLTDSLHANSRVVFFPTSITSKMTDIISRLEKDRICVGLRGCGKTYAIVLNAMLNQKIITAFMDPNQLSQIMKSKDLPQQSQISKIHQKFINGETAKIFYWTIDQSQKNIFQIYKNVFNIISMQCQEVHKQIEQISQKIRKLESGDDQIRILFEQFCVKVKNCYNDKKIFVMLIVDQINTIASRFRQAQRLVFEQKKTISRFSASERDQYLIGKNNDNVRLSIQNLYDYSLYNSSMNIQKNLIFPKTQVPPHLKQMAIAYGTSHSGATYQYLDFQEDFKNTDQLTRFISFEFERGIEKSYKSKGKQLPKLLQQDPNLSQKIEKQCKQDKNKDWLPYLRPFFIFKMISQTMKSNKMLKFLFINDDQLRSKTKEQFVRLMNKFIKKFIIEGVDSDTDKQLKGLQISLLERKVFASKLKLLIDKYKDLNQQLNVSFSQITQMDIKVQTIQLLLDSELFHIEGQRIYTRGPASFVAEIFDEVFKKTPALLDIYTILRSFQYRKSGQGNDLEVAVALAFQNSPIINLVGNKPTVSYRMVPSVGKFEVLRYDQKNPNKFSCFEKCIQMLQEGINKDSSKDSILCVPMKNTTIDVEQKNLIPDESVGTDFVVISKNNQVLQINFTEITLGTGIIKKQRNFIKLLSSFEEMVRDNGSRKRLIDKYDIRVNLHLLTLNYSKDQNKIGVRQIFLKEVKSKENQMIKEQQKKTQSNGKYTESKVQRFVSGNQVKPQNLNTNKQVQQKSKINLDASQIQNFQNNLLYVNQYIRIFKIEELQLLGNENEMLSMQAIIKLIKKKTEKEKK